MSNSGDGPGDEELSSLEKRLVAAYSAPRLRAAKTRRVKVVNASGEVVREITSLEFQQAIHERAGIEFDVEPGIRRTRIVCACGRVIPVSSKTAHNIKRCKICSGSVCFVCNKPLTSPSIKPKRCWTCEMARRRSLGKGKHDERENLRSLKKEKRDEKKRLASSCFVCGAKCSNSTMYKSLSDGCRPKCGKHRHFREPVGDE